MNKIMELDADVLSLAPAPRDFSSSGGFFGGKMSQCFKNVARVSSDIPPGRRCSELHPSCSGSHVESMRSSWTTMPFFAQSLDPEWDLDPPTCEVQRGTAEYGMLQACFFSHISVNMTFLMKSYEVI